LHLPEGRILALDLGQQQVGVAITDELQIAVRPLLTLRRSSWKRLVQELSQTVRQYDARLIVIGLPLRMDGTDGEAAAEMRRLAHNLELSLKIPVLLHDERLTSREAEELLKSSNGNLEQIDAYAAAIILQDFISNLKNR
jgi:putative holliday junction resolvase